MSTRATIYVTTSFGVYHTPELLAQFRVERLKERLVEELHRVSIIETLEEFIRVNAIERGGCPVQHFDQSQRLKLFDGLAICWKSVRMNGTVRCQTAVRQSNFGDERVFSRAHSTHAENTP